MHEIYLLLGSNLGKREKLLLQAAEQIEAVVGEILKKSSVYQTQSWGVNNQPDYLNQVIFVKTSLKPRELLSRILLIEKGLGRKRIEKWGSRHIDIDILFYGDEIIDEPDLVVPHQYFHERRFAVEPMLEIAPDFIHPKLKKSIKSIALELTDKLSVQNLNHI